MHFIITGGGTGGHIFPALEIAQEFKSYETPIQITYVGNSNGPERNFAYTNNLEFFGLNTNKLVGQNILKKFLALIYLAQATCKSLIFLLKKKPDAVIGVGGYVSAPMLIAAFILGIRRYVCEQNVVPGLANKYLAYLAHGVFTSFSQSNKYFPQPKIIVAGNPVRKAFFSISPKSFKQEQSLRILISGGSMGATFLNTYVPQALKLVQDKNIKLEITHQCGGKNFQEIKNYYQNNNLNYNLETFINNMPEAFSNHDILISRAGATVSAEILAAGMPAILVPYRFAQAHQKANAQALAEKNACLVVEEGPHFVSSLSEIIINLNNNKHKLEELSAHAKALAQPKAASLIVSTVLKECQ